MSGPSVDRTGWKEVRAELLRRIREGELAPGAAMPGEVDLAAEFGVARATMNRAMRELTDEGLLERRRKSGTRVRPSPRRAARFEIPLIRAEIEATGAAYGYQLLERAEQPAPEWLAGRLGIAAGAGTLHLVCLHLADDAVFQVEDRWINLSALPAARQEGFDAEGPNEWLVRAVPWSEVEVSFLADAADATLAQRLSVAPGAPVFTALRTTWWGGQGLTHVRLSFRSGYRMTTRY